MFGLIVLLFVPFASAQLFFQPQQIHLAYGENTNDMVVTWSTYTDTSQSSVEFGTDGLTQRVEGSSFEFVDGGLLRSTQYIHKVTLKNLTYNTKYLYHCGSDLGWSEEFWFKTPPTNDEWQPSLVVYGDLGNIDGQSLPRLQQETQNRMYDAIFHIGDFAYNLHSNNGLYGDEFMRQIQPVAAYVPYMTCPGNHESAYNFSHYKARFNMPGDSQSQWYTMDMGPMHIIVISTEVFFFTNYGIAPLLNQYQWLERELTKANLPENRAKQPWLVVAGHRPIYCYHANGKPCEAEDTIMNNGDPEKNILSLEKLLYDHGVDLELWAHLHSYERLWPVYDYGVYNGSLNEPYRNPGAPVHITSGSPGSLTHPTSYKVERAPWCAFRSLDYGYTRLKVYNSTHLYVEQVSDEKDGEIIDKVWIIKDTHGPYENP